MLDETTARERHAAGLEGIRLLWQMMISAGIGVIVMALVTSLWWPVKPLGDVARPLTTPGIWFMPIGWSIFLGYVADLAAWPLTHKPLRMPWRAAVNFAIGVAVGAWFVRGPACRLSVLDAALGFAWTVFACVWPALIALAIGRARIERARAAGRSA